MVNEIVAELLKLKRKKFLLISVGVLLLYLMCILGTVANAATEVTARDFRSFLFNPYLPILLIHSIAIGIIGITIFSKEYSAGTMGQLVVAATSMFRLFVAKLLVIFMFSMVWMFGVALEVILCGLILGYQGVTVTNILLALTFFMQCAFTLVLGLLPVIFIGVICKRNTMVPIASLFLYLMITLLPSMGVIRIDSDLMAYIYPFGGAVILQRDFLYYSMPDGFTGWITPTTNTLLCMVCLSAFSILFSALSIFTLNRNTTCRKGSLALSQRQNN